VSQADRLSFSLARDFFFVKEELLHIKLYFCALKLKEEKLNGEIELCVGNEYGVESDKFGVEADRNRIVRESLYGDYG
jgi:hypothetical protein